MKEQQLEQAYSKHELRFAKTLDFIEAKKNLKERIDAVFNATIIINKESGKEKLRLLFIDTINAAGSSNLTRNGKACKFFYSKIDNLPDASQINIQDFYNSFSTHIRTLHDFYVYLHSSKKIINFGKKKAALFIYKIHRLQKILPTNQKIFIDYNCEELDLVIPVDIVITLVLNKLLRLRGTNVLKQYRDFDLINSFFKKKVGDRFMLLEDFWFWGYFTTKGKGNDRKFVFNEDKFYTSNFIQPNSENRELLMRFLSIIKE